MYIVIVTRIFKNTQIFFIVSRELRLTNSCYLYYLFVYNVDVTTHCKIVEFFVREIDIFIRNIVFLWSKERVLAIVYLTILDLPWSDPETLLNSFQRRTS